MRKICVAILLSAVFALPVSAQTDDRSMSLSISPVAPIFGGVDLLYQIKVTDFLAITVPANFYYAWPKTTIVKVIADSNKDFSATKAPISYATGLGAKFLLANNGISDSFYLEPRVMVGYSQFGVKYTLQGAANEFDASSWNVSPMARLGWDWVYESGFFMTLGVGAGVNIYFKNVTNIPNKIQDNFAIKALFPTEKGVGFAWDGEFKLGYAW